MSEVNSVTGLGTVAKPLPRVMIVDTPGKFFSAMVHNPDEIRKKYGCEPVFVLYNPEFNIDAEMEHASNTRVKSYSHPESIVAYAQDPDSKIDMVLTGNVFRGENYGQKICNDLKRTPASFAGNVAIQGMYQPLKEIHAKAAGAIGFYDKINYTDAQTSGLKALMDAHAQAQGHTR